MYHINRWNINLNRNNKYNNKKVNKDILVFHDSIGNDFHIKVNSKEKIYNIEYINIYNNKFEELLATVIPQYKM